MDLSSSVYRPKRLPPWGSQLPASTVTSLPSYPLSISDQSPPRVPAQTPYSPSAPLSTSCTVKNVLSVFSTASVCWKLSRIVHLIASATIHLLVARISTSSAFVSLQAAPVTSVMKSKIPTMLSQQLDKSVPLSWLRISTAMLDVLGKGKVRAVVDKGVLKFIDVA